MLWGHRGLEHPFPVVMDALAAGCALAMMQPFLRRSDNPLRQRQFLIVPCLTALMPLIQFVSNRTYQVAGLTILHLGIALSIQHAVHVRYRVLNLRPVVWLGALSYSLYLWQQPFLNRGSTAWWTGVPAETGPGSAVRRSVSLSGGEAIPCAAGTKQEGGKGSVFQKGSR
jgi:peptidoglycan/LPS O-acetylase OafA/YrhL